MLTPARRKILGLHFKVEFSFWGWSHCTSNIGLINKQSRYSSKMKFLFLNLQFAFLQLKHYSKRKLCESQPKFLIDNAQVKMHQRIEYVLKSCVTYLNVLQLYFILLYKHFISFNHWITSCSPLHGPSPLYLVFLNFISISLLTGFNHNTHILSSFCTFYINLNTPFLSF